MNNKWSPRAVNVWAGANPWGYQFNVNHPTVSRLYKEYQQQHGLDMRIAMTDAQRRAFEAELLQRMREKSQETHERDVHKILDDLTRR